MSILFSLKTLFSDPEFPAGGRVNAISSGHMVDRTDGLVLTQSQRGVLVEWPCGNTSLVCPTKLVRIDG